MKKQVTTALALILALGAAPVIAQETPAPTPEQPSDPSTPTDPSQPTEPTDPSQPEPTDPADETTDGEADKVSVLEVEEDDRDEIRAILVGAGSAPLATVDFDVSVGVAVPATVVINPVPVQVVEISPAFDGYQYFLLPDGRIAIVDPVTLEIVLIIEA
jgi:hypothetical protein